MRLKKKKAKLVENHLPTTELQELDAAHHLHPFTDHAALNAVGSRVIVRADGVYLWDSDGNRILDGMAGLWCVNVGYGRAELADAAAAQMRQLPYYNTFFQSSHPPAIALAERLAGLAPEHITHVFFAGSGSDANDTNIRMVRQYWAARGEPNKRIIISRRNAYHGSTMGSASLGGMAFMHAQGGLPIPDIVHIDQPYWYGEGGDIDEADFGIERARQLEAQIDALGEDTIAAFIAEPIQGAGGVIIPPETYWPEVMRICREREILFVADEVICGFGRTGHWFGSDSYDLSPDIMTIAKGLSSGYLPIGGSLVSSKVAEVLSNQGTEFAHGYTYSAHPVACAVALENVRILAEEKLVERVHDHTRHKFAAALAALSDHPMVGQVRTRGLLGAIELSPDPARRAPFAAPRGTIGQICRDLCVANGLVMRAVGDTMVISPPLIIADAEIDELVTRAHRAIDQTMAQVRADGMLC